MSSINTTNTIQSDASLVINSDDTGANLYLVRVLCVGNGTGYDVNAQIFRRAASAYTQLASTSLFTGLSGDFRCQIVAIITTPDLGFSFNIRCIVNGKDTNCVTGPLSDTIFGERCGARAVTNGATPVTVFFSKFYSKQRVQILSSAANCVQPLAPFTDTGGPAGNFPMNIALNGLSLLDTWSLAATAENYVWRKDCRRLTIVPPSQVFTDEGEPISWGPQGYFNLAVPSSLGGNGVMGGTGMDLSKSIILEEGVHIISGGALANAESLGTELKLGFSPSNNSGGQLVWPDVAGMIALGKGPLPQNISNAPPLLFTDTLNATGLTDFSTARRLAENMGANKSVVNAGAKRFTILRTKDISAPRTDVFKVQRYDNDNNALEFVAACPQAFRELDFITINVPSLDIFMQKVSVISYTFREAEPNFEVILDQYSFHQKQLAGRRMSNNIDTGLLTFAPR
jgi:hypothetical protein